MRRRLKRAGIFRVLKEPCRKDLGSRNRCYLARKKKDVKFRNESKLALFASSDDRGALLLCENKNLAVRNAGLG